MKLINIVIIVIINQLFPLFNSLKRNERKDEEKDPFSMEINHRTTEAMRLIKIEAIGLLPQIGQTSFAANHSCEKIKTISDM